MDRPSSSPSGGHAVVVPEDEASVVVAAAAVVAAAPAPVAEAFLALGASFEALPPLAPFMAAAKASFELQARHGLPSGPSTTAGC